MIFDPNPLYFKMAKLVSERDPKSKLIIGNEGSTRSSKTFDTLHLITAICDASKNGAPLDIYFFRDTLVNCKEYLLKDFKKCLGIMGIYDEANYRDNGGKPNYNLFGHIIKFRGLDDSSKEIKEGSDSDIIFFNEILSGCDQDRVKGFIMRCRMLVIADWNPKYSDHWFFSYSKRNDTVFTHSTYKQNRHLEDSVIKEIEAYSPWMLEDMHLPEDQRRAHEENVRTGTVDKYRWLVYGLGIRANREGLVFPEVTFIDAFPSDCEQIAYGIDFGSNHPTVIVRVGLKKLHPKSSIFLQKLFYSPVENSNIIIDAVKKLQIKKHIWCDNNMPGWITDMRVGGIAAMTTTKFPGSREYWITTLKKFNLHIVQDIDFKREQENFCYRVVDGITLSETIDTYDDCWSASGYAVVGDFRY